MKKVLRLGIAGLAAFTLLSSGCSGKASSGTDASTESSSGETTEETLAETESYADEGSINLADYSSIPVTVTRHTVTDQNVEDKIQQTLDANPNYVEVDRAAQNGDRVNIDYTGKIDGNEFDGGSAKAYDLDLGSGTFIDGFEDGVVGMKKGDTKDLNLKFPDDYSNSDVAGKDVVFTVTVNSVSEKQDAVLDEAFLQRIGSEYTTVDAYRQSVRDSLEQQEQESEKSEIQQQVLAYLVENSEITLGKSDVDQVYNRYIISVSNMASQYGMTVEDLAKNMYGVSYKVFCSMIRHDSETSVKSTMVLKAVAEKENLTVEDADTESYAESLGYDSLDAMESSSGQSQDSIKSSLLQQKALDFLTEKAQVTYTEETTAASEDASDAADGSAADGGTAAADETAAEAAPAETTEAVGETFANAADGPAAESSQG